jgi:hypothetical protein
MNLLLPTHSKITTAQAVHILSTNVSIADLDRATLDAIHVLVQAQMRKTANRTKALDCPFKLASLFLPKNLKKEPRQYLHNIRATGEYLLASTGYIAIKIKHECTPGYYTVNKVLVDDDSKYPDFNKAVNTFKSGASVLLADCDTRSIAVKTSVCVYTVGADNNRVECGIDKQYVDLIKSIGITSATISTQGLYFQSDSGSFEGVVCAHRLPKKITDS